MWGKFGHVTPPNPAPTKPSNSTEWNLEKQGNQKVVRNLKAGSARNLIHLFFPAGVVFPAGVAYQAASIAFFVLLDLPLCLS